MIIGRVVGEVISTVQHPSYGAHTLLVVARTDAAGSPTGDYVIAVDAIGAGRGEMVLVVDEGSSARQVLSSSTAPVRSVVVGHIDAITLAAPPA